MKSTNYSNGKVATKAITLILSLLFFNTIAAAQVFQMGNCEYRFEDSKWFNYSSGIKGDLIVPDRLIVRLASREKPALSDFTNLGISGVNAISLGALFAQYRDEFIEATIAEKLWVIFLNIQLTIAETFGIDYTDIMKVIFQQPEVQKTLKSLSEIFFEDHFSIKLGKAA